MQILTGEVVPAAQPAVLPAAVRKQALVSGFQKYSRSVLVKVVQPFIRIPFLKLPDSLLVFPLCFQEADCEGPAVRSPGCA